MSTVQYYEEAFKSSRESASCVLDSIRQKFQQIGENKKRRTSFSCLVLNGVCKAIDNKGNFFDSYCSALKLILKNVDPTTDEWSPFLAYLKYFYYELCRVNRLKDASEIVSWIKSLGEPSIWLKSTENDFKSLLKIFVMNISQCSKTDESITSAIGNVIALFNEVCNQKHFSITFLLMEFRNCQKFFLNSTFLTQSGINEQTEMFDAFFRAFKYAGTMTIESKNVEIIFMENLKLLRSFIQFDATGQTQITLNFLKECKTLMFWNKHNAYLGYIFSIFYYYWKVVYDPKEVLIRDFPSLLTKFITTLEYMSTIAKNWSMDAIVMSLQIIAKPTASLNGIYLYENFWKKIDSNCFLNKYRLLVKIMKIASGITYDANNDWKCCNSIRKHLIIDVCHQSIEFYNQYVQNIIENNAENDQEISQGTIAIVKYAVSVIEVMKCSRIPYSTLLNSLKNLILHVKNNIQLDNCIKMMEYITKVQPLTIQNVWKRLFANLIFIAKEIGNEKRLAEALCFNAALSLSYDMPDYETANKSIALYYQMNPDLCVCEFLDHSKSPLKVTNYNRRLLHSLESDIALKKIRTTNILTLTSLLKCCETSLDFILIARNTSEVAVSSKVQDIYGKLKKKRETSSLTPIEQLELGHICKWLFDDRKEKLCKQLPSGTKYNDAGLEQLYENDLAKIRRIDVFNETKIIKFGIEATEAFKCFFDACEKVQEIYIDWVALIDDLSFVARILHFRGYMDYACQSWLLVYKIANTLDDVLNQIRALSFIYGESEFVQQHQPDFNFEDEFQKKSLIILNCYLDLDNLTPRRQNYVLLCICNLADYYIKIENLNISKILLNLVEKKVKVRKEYDVVKATYDASLFFLYTRSTEKFLPIRPLNQLEHILEQYRNLTYISTEDSTNYPLLLFKIVGELSDYLAIRMIDSSVVVYLHMCAKLAFDFGAGLRAAQILLKWAYTNLQAEEAEKSQIKLQIIDCLMQFTKSSNVTNAKSKTVVTSRNPVLKEKSNQWLIDQQIGMLEAVRKVMPVMLSPIKSQKLSVQQSNTNLSIYLPDNIELPSLIMQRISIEAGCLNARVCYLIEEHATLENFYTNALKWIEKNSKNAPKFFFRNCDLKLTMHFANYLRYSKKYEYTLEIIDNAFKNYNDLDKPVDAMYWGNLTNQRMASLENIDSNLTKTLPVFHRNVRNLERSLNSVEIIEISDDTIDSDNSSKSKENIPKKNTKQKTSSAKYVKKISTQRRHKTIENISKELKSINEIKPIDVIEISDDQIENTKIKTSKNKQNTVTSPAKCSRKINNQTKNKPMENIAKKPVDKTENIVLPQHVVSKKIQNNLLKGRNAKSKKVDVEAIQSSPVSKRVRRKVAALQNTNLK